MQVTNTPDAVGRISSELADKLRLEISRGKAPGGRFLPSVRRLASRFGAAKKTVERALRQLEAEGLIVSVPRQGFRVLPRAGEPDRGLPLAYVAHVPGDAAEFWDEFHKQLLACFQQVAAAKGWSLLVAASRKGNAAEVLDQLRSAGVCGAIVDSFDEGVHQGLEHHGIPYVVVDGWLPGIACDMVNQDGFLGATLAAGHLLKRGHRKVAFFGARPMSGDLQIPARYAGAAAALLCAGLHFAPEDVALAPLDDRDGIVRAARELLSRDDRPRAILSLWQRVTAGLCVAARELNLVPGRDFEMVGWSTEEGYASAFLPNFNGGPVPPAVTWRVAEMAETAVRLLKLRRAEPAAAPMHQRVSVRLRVPEGGRNDPDGMADG